MSSKFVRQARSLSSSSQSLLPRQFRSPTAPRSSSSLGGHHAPARASCSASLTCFPSFFLAGATRTNEEGRSRGKGSSFPAKRSPWTLRTQKLQIGRPLSSYLFESIDPPSAPTRERRQARVLLDAGQPEAPLEPPREILEPATLPSHCTRPAPLVPPRELLEPAASPSRSPGHSGVSVHPRHHSRTGNL